MPVFFIEPGSIQDNHIVIEGPLAHHLVGSLRIQAGEKLWLGEPGGPRYQAQVMRVEKERLTAGILTQIPIPPLSIPHVTLGIALINSQHLEWAIQKATELGVARVSLLITRRTVVQPRSERITKQLTRWQNVAREAAQQSMRWEIPDVAPPETLSQWCTRHAHTDRRFVLWENSQGVVLRKELRSGPKPSTVAVAIGPEGGFDADEVKFANDKGFAIVSLGSRILRTESAALTALTLIQYEWGDLG
jgi:16S rRNA (uracil1498-N3)-methyltransferase